MGSLRRGVPDSFELGWPPPELSWSPGTLGPPPASRPEYDWDLDRWIRGRCGDGCSRDRGKAFYDSARWLRLRRRVLDEAHGASLWELGQSPARFVPATTVHHVMRVGQWPGWALSEWAVGPDGSVVRNLIPLSHDGHDAAHGRFGFRRQRGRGGDGPLTPERW